MTSRQLEAEIRSGPFGPKTAAVFDVDGTLIGGHLATAEPGEWAGRPESELAELGEQSFAGAMAGDVRHDAWWLVKAHQRAGHTVVLTSSAAEAFVAPLARELGVEHVVATRFESRDGRLTGGLTGRVPRGDGKLDAVRDLLTEHGARLEDTHVYTGGDDDIPLLAAVGHPHPVDPGAGLAAAATGRGWPVLRFGGDRPGSLDPRPALRTAGIFGTLIDFLVTARVIRTGYTAVAKAEVKQMPVVGPLFDLAGVAFLDRANRAKAIDALRPAVETLRSGVSVVMAPEGTRSLTPQMGPFKKGGFHLAMQAGVPIVPIVIRNAGEIMWRNAKTVRSGTVQVAVLPPVHTDGWRADDLDQHVTELRNRYLDTLENWPAT